MVKGSSKGSGSARDRRRFCKDLLGLLVRAQVMWYSRRTVVI